MSELPRADNRCPLCKSDRVYEYVSADALAEEAQLRARFVDDRFAYKPDAAERMDLTEFMHGGPGRLLTCRACGIARRDEDDAAHYADDVYDESLVQHLYPRYLEAFRRRARRMERWLPPRARIVEAGCHYGAFLQAAEERNWQPLGLDVGERLRFLWMWTQ